MSVIEKWKNDPTVSRYEDEHGNKYGIRVLGRGENLFFQENDKALVCVIDAVHSVIFEKSIKNWEGEKRMSKGERSRVSELIIQYYKKAINENVTLSN
ncbi:MAG: hypothetical protein MI808_19635 [Pseudomonadales bacterium]|nr:hypothetical protein [Pseudomonadales bacterium]